MRSHEGYMTITINRNIVVYSSDFNYSTSPYLYGSSAVLCADSKLISQMFISQLVQYYNLQYVRYLDLLTSLVYLYTGRESLYYIDLSQVQSFIFINLTFLDVYIAIDVDSIKFCAFCNVSYFLLLHADPQTLICKSINNKIQKFYELIPDSKYLTDLILENVHLEHEILVSKLFPFLLNLQLSVMTLANEQLRSLPYFLHRLELIYCDLEKMPDLLYLVNLHELNLSSNGKLVFDYENVPKSLLNLYFENNELKADFSVALLENLYFISLKCTSLVGYYILTSGKLSYLNLYDCQLAEVPLCAYNNPLVYLNLADNHICFRYPLHSLKKLDIYRCQLRAFPDLSRCLWLYAVIANFNCFNYISFALLPKSTLYLELLACYVYFIDTRCQLPHLQYLVIRDNYLPFIYLDGTVDYFIYDAITVAITSRYSYYLLFGMLYENTKWEYVIEHRKTISGLYQYILSLNTQISKILM